MSANPFFRVDNRLVHGQIIATWLPHLRLQRFLIASDTVPSNTLQTTMFRMAIPSEVGFEALSIDAAARALADPALQQSRVMVLIESVADAVRLFAGFSFGQLNLGNVHHAADRERITDAVYLGPSDLQALGQLAARGVRVDVRSLPSEAPLDLTPRLGR